MTPEAMASGLAVVADDHAEAAELITSGYDGCLAPMLDEDALVTQAMALVNDPVLAHTLGAAARRMALELDWDCIVDQTEYVFVRAILGTGVGTGQAAAPRQEQEPPRALASTD